MTFLYIVLSLLGLACTYNLFHPQSRHAGLGIASFVFGVLWGELAIFLLPLQITGVALFILCGVVQGFWLKFLLLLTLLSWLAQLVYIVNAVRSAGPLRAALDSAGIANYDVDGKLIEQSVDAVTATVNTNSIEPDYWQRVRKPFSIRLDNVACQKGIIYKTVDGQNQALDIYHDKNLANLTRAPVLLRFTVIGRAHSPSNDPGSRSGRSRSPGSSGSSAV